MVAPRVLAGAIVPALFDLAVGLGARPAQTQPLEPSSGGPPQRRSELSVDDLIAAGRDADEEDDFDTWYFEHAGNPASRFSAGFEAEGPEKFGPSLEERTRVEKAWKHCNQGYLSHGAVPLENGVITYLVTRRTDLWQLRDSLPGLRSFVLKHWAYDVKVFIPSEALRKYDPASFQDSPSEEKVVKALQETLGDEYNFEVVSFDVRFPKVIADDGNWKHKLNGCAKAVSTSYKHMNQFFTKTMYEHPALNKYKYYLRIDADFKFKAAADGESIKADPFCLMAKSGRKFMWQTRREVHNKQCTEGLKDWFVEYAKAQGLTPHDDLFWRTEGTVNYVGYAGMGDLDFFRSEPVRRLAEALNEDGRVYLNRWSDQAYYVFLFALFENHTAVGDIGFNWGYGGYHPHKTVDTKWCHKCYDPEA